MQGTYRTSGGYESEAAAWSRNVAKESNRNPAADLDVGHWDDIDCVRLIFTGPAFAARESRWRWLVERAESEHGSPRWQPSQRCVLHSRRPLRCSRGRSDFPRWYCRHWTSDFGRER